MLLIHMYYCSSSNLWFFGGWRKLILQCRTHPFVCFSCGFKSPLTAVPDFVGCSSASVGSSSSWTKLHWSYEVENRHSIITTDSYMTKLTAASWGVSGAVWMTSGSGGKAFSVGSATCASPASGCSGWLDKDLKTHTADKNTTARLLTETSIFFSFRERQMNFHSYLLHYQWVFINNVILYLYYIWIALNSMQQHFLCLHFQMRHKTLTQLCLAVLAALSFFPSH